MRCNGCVGVSVRVGVDVSVDVGVDVCVCGCACICVAAAECCIGSWCVSWGLFWVWVCSRNVWPIYTQLAAAEAQSDQNEVTLCAAFASNLCPGRCNFVIRVGQNRIYNIYTVYDRIYGNFPAKNTVYTLYIYGSGQPYL